MKRKLKLLFIIIFKIIYLHIFFKSNPFNKIINKFLNLKPLVNNMNANPLKVAKLTRLIIRYIFFSQNCFHRSFISAGVLKIIGIKVKLIIGVSLTDSFKSHAWVEVDGLPILENLDIDNFKIIYKS